MLALTLLSVALAIDPVSLDRAHWDMADGLPQSTVTDLMQTRDGLLVFATFGGVVRFDGVSFEIWDASSNALPSIRVTAIAEDSEGGWWLGTQDGTLSLLDEGVVSSIDVPGDLDTVWDLAVDAGGHLWLASPRGIAEIHEGTWTWHSSRPSHGVVAWPGVGIAGLDDHGLIVIQGDASTRWLADEELHAVALQGDRVVAVGDAGTIAFDADGHMTPLSDRAGHRLAAGATDVWVGGDGNVWSVDGHEVRGVANAPVRSMLVDREGNLWVGWVGQGLSRLSEQPFRQVSSRPSQAILGTDDGAFIARCVDSEPLVRTHGGEVEAIAPLGSKLCVRALQHVGDEVWFAEDSVVSAWSSDGTTRAVMDFHEMVLAIGAGGRLVGTGRGLWQADGDTWSVVPGIPGPVAAIVDDGEARWVGHAGGASLWSGGAWRTWSSAEGVPHVQVRDIWPVGDGSAWLGTYGAGLIFVGDAPTRRLTSSAGLQEHVVSRMLDDGRGGMWLLGNRGVSRVPISDLEAFSEGRMIEVRSRLWLSGEGNGGVQPAGDRVGHELWFPTVDGVVAFEPALLQSNAVAPRVVLRSAIVDGVAVAEGEIARLPAGPGKLDVVYTVAALAQPELARFEYRFGDEPWNDVGSSRQLSWEGLPPGPYRLEIRATNEDGVVSDAPLEIRFALAIPWFERWWVRLGAVLGVMSLGVAAHRLRTRFVENQNRAMQSEITQRERAERALRRSEEHYRGIFRGAGDGMLSVDGIGVIRDANPAARVMFSSSSLVGRPLSEFVGETRVDGLARCLRQDGTDFDAQVVVLVDEHGGRVVSLRDVEPLRRAAESERLEAVGRLAGGVAHDINNLLTVLSGVSAVMGDEIDQMGGSSLATELLGDVDACVVRGGTLTRELMAFGRRQYLLPQSQSLAPYLARLRPRLERAVPAGVTVRLDPVDLTLGMQVDPGQLELALLNLVLNGANAMNDIGEIQLRCYPSGDEVVVEVEDQGRGIPPDVMPHIYEPFFTTRDTGSGLGLASVHGFVAQSAGRIEVSSEVGRGTLFRLYFPRTERHDDTPLPAVETAPRGATVLVCDDDLAVLGSLERMLRSGGYTVVATSDALEAAGRDPFAVDLLVTDVLMPSLRGPELAERLRARRPDLPILFVSGFVDDETVPGPMLSKPFSQAELLDAVDALLTRTT